MTDLPVDRSVDRSVDMRDKFPPAETGDVGRPCRRVVGECGFSIGERREVYTLRKTSKYRADKQLRTHRGKTRHCPLASTPYGMLQAEGLMRKASMVLGLDCATAAAHSVIVLRAERKSQELR